MKLENQVCSLELAKKLKELGVKQESLFYHDIKDKKNIVLHSGAVPPFDKGYFLESLKTWYSAFTVAELGEKLPATIWIDRKSFHFLIQRTASAGWQVSYYNFDSRIMHCFEIANTEADARAKMLIYLLENKLI